MEPDEINEHHFTHPFEDGLTTGSTGKGLGFCEPAELSGPAVF